MNDLPRGAANAAGGELLHIREVSATCPLASPGRPERPPARDGNSSRRAEEGDLHVPGTMAHLWDELERPVGQAIQACPRFLLGGLHK